MSINFDTVDVVDGHPCDECQDSEVLWLDRSAGEVECQDCGSIYFTDEEEAAAAAAILSEGSR